MTEPAGTPPATPAPSPVPRGNTLEPLPGEPGIPNVAKPPSLSMSWKFLAGAVLLVLSVAVAATLFVQHFFESRKKPDDQASRNAGDRPAAATTEPKRLDLSLVSTASARPASAASVRIPALVPTDDEIADPIGMRREARPATPPPASKTIAPEDAPAVLVSSRPDASTVRSPRPSIEPEGSAGEPLDRTRRNLDGYQRQLQGLLDTLSQTTAAATSPARPTPSAPPGTLASTSAPVQAPGSLFGGQLQGTATPRTIARLLDGRSLILPKGTTFTCALKTRVVSAASGLVGCQVQRNVYSDDGRVLLIERGSHLDGEYRITSVRPGTVRIPVLWTRIRTPNGVIVDLDSPGTGPLGESGIDGYVDNRWGERIGAAMLLSLIDDSVSLLIQRESSGQQGNTILLPSTSANTSKLAEKVLDSTINIPPLIYQNQGGIVGIYVARDVDFSSVYELKPVER